VVRATVAVLAGDGIGGEVTAEGVRALAAVAMKFGHSPGIRARVARRRRHRRTGEALPAATLARVSAPMPCSRRRRRPAVVRSRCKGEAGAGSPGIAQGTRLFANLRPVVPHPAVLDASPIKAELLQGVDIMVVRELTGGIYFGDKHRTATEAVDVCRYNRRRDRAGGGGWPRSWHRRAGAA